MAVGHYLQCLLDVPVTGKGKRKLDDVAAHAGSYTMAGCTSARLVGNQLTPDVVSVSYAAAVIDADTAQSDVPSNSLLNITPQDAHFSYAYGSGKNVSDSHCHATSMQSRPSTSAYQWIEFKFKEKLMPGPALDATGVPLPKETLTATKQSYDVLLGAIVGYKWDKNEKHLKPETGLLQLHDEIGEDLLMREQRSLRKSTSQWRTKECLRCGSSGWIRT